MIAFSNVIFFDIRTPSAPCVRNDFRLRTFRREITVGDLFRGSCYFHSHNTGNVFPKVDGRSLCITFPSSARNKFNTESELADLGNSFLKMKSSWRGGPPLDLVPPPSSPTAVGVAGEGGAPPGDFSLPPLEIEKKLSAPNRSIEERCFY